jgi:hypothetical protein
MSDKESNEYWLSKRLNFLDKIYSKLDEKDESDLRKLINNLMNIEIDHEFHNCILNGSWERCDLHLINALNKYISKVNHNTMHVPYKHFTNYVKEAFQQAFKDNRVEIRNQWKKKQWEPFKYSRQKTFLDNEYYRISKE